MAKSEISVRVTMAGGASLDLTVKNGCTLAEIFAELRAAGFSMGDKVSINGEEAEPSAVPEEGDVITAHKTPEGGF